jgi:hypothetical protein
MNVFSRLTNAGDSVFLFFLAFVREMRVQWRYMIRCQVDYFNAATGASYNCMHAMWIVDDPSGNAAARCTPPGEHRCHQITPGVILVRRRPMRHVSTEEGTQCDVIAARCLFVASVDRLLHLPQCSRVATSKKRKTSICSFALSCQRFFCGQCDHR